MKLNNKFGTITQNKEKIQPWPDETNQNSVTKFWILVWRIGFRQKSVCAMAGWIFSRECIVGNLTLQNENR